MLIPQDLICEAKSKFGEKAAFIIAESLNLDNFDEKNLKACCPFHNEDTPSFVFNNKNYHYHCFGCNTNFDILDLYMKQGNTYLESIQKLFNETNIKYKFGEKNVKTKKNYKYPNPEDNNNRHTVEDYLKKRKINKETLDYCDVRQDCSGNIVFNYYDTNDVLTMVKYRPARKLQQHENKMWCQKNADTSNLLFNMNRIDPSKPLLICEGEIDCLAAIESGFKNTVSIPLGAGNEHWIEENWEWLEQFEKIIIWSDSDAAGQKMKKNIIPRLGEWRCYEVESPTQFINNENTISIKDINEVLYYFGSEKVLECIYTAKEIPITNIIDLSDIKDFDIENAEGISSGFKEFDKWIYKFFFGCLNIITGLNGGGKSVLVNQMCIAEPVNQGYDVFVFSGELTKPQLKNWLDLNFAGRRHIKVKNNHIRQIDTETKNIMQDWYKSHIHVYDNDKDFSAKSLLNKMEELARKKGVKVFNIDNLMMIDLECNMDNIWQKQKEFIVKLVNFANKFNVLVNLVAHPKKIECIRRLTKLDIGGSGDITNLAHYVMAVHRVTAKEKAGTLNKHGQYVVQPIEYDCIIDLFKNRITGTQDKELGVYFDLPSYRFWTDTEELDKQYNWDNQTYNVKLSDPRNENLPEFIKE